MSELSSIDVEASAELVASEASGELVELSAVELVEASAELVEEVELVELSAELVDA